MRVTAENKETVESFMNILIGIGLEDEAEGIVLMMDTLEQMDKMVEFIEGNQKADKREYLNKAGEIILKS